MPSNKYYDHGSIPTFKSFARSIDMRNEFDAITTGFDLIDTEMDDKASVSENNTFTGDNTFEGDVTYAAGSTVTYEAGSTVVYETNVTIIGGSEALLPDQAGNNGKVLGTDGSAVSWVAMPTSGSILPDQTGNSGRVLGTNGSTVSWVLQTGGSGGSADMSVTLADEEYAAVVYDSGLAGESMSFGHLILFTAGKWWKATNVSANQDTTTEDAGWARLGICGTTGTIQADDTITVVLQGKVRCDALYSWTSDCRCLFVGPTAGEMYPNANEGLMSSKCIVRIVGHPVSTSEIYFNPANNFFITSEV